MKSVQDLFRLLNLIAMIAVPLLNLPRAWRQLDQDKKESIIQLAESFKDGGEFLNALDEWKSIRDGLYTDPTSPDL